MLIPSVMREIQRVYAPQGARAALPESAPAEKPAATRRFDSVTLSPAAARLASALNAAQTAPDVRQERVDRVRADIASGVYGARADDIAKALLKRGEES